MERNQAVATGVPIGLQPAEGPAFWTMGQLMTIKLRKSDTAGELGAMETLLPPNVAVPSHIHHRESEVNFVLEGWMRFTLDGQVFECGPGGLVYLPSGHAHRFETGPEGARMLAIALPGGLEELYERVGVPASERRLPTIPADVAGWMALAPEFGIELLGPPPGGSQPRP
jgi:quercetin dioxygenase-like cupin family protein